MNRPKYYTPTTARKNQHTYHFRPRVNVLESDEAYKVIMSLAGYEREDLNITVEEDVLTIASEKAWTAAEGDRVTRKEFKLAPFKRSFTLPRGVESEKIEAKMNNGLLEIAVHKKAKQTITVS
ncbi:MAG: Hsp20/alpha crystallin family protein [Bacteroidota bacterium]